MTSIAASSTKIRLKKVKQWVRMISCSLLPVGFGVPAGVRWAACSQVRPTSGSVQKGSCFCSMEVRSFAVLL